MDFVDSPLDLVSIGSLLLLLLIDSNRFLLESSAEVVDMEDDAESPVVIPMSDNGTGEVDEMCRAALHHFHLWSNLNFLEEDLGYWVKPRSTTWFIRFLLHEYDDDRWIEMFRFTKKEVFNLAALLSPAIHKQDTKYRRAIPVAVRLACTLFKLSHGASFLICSEMFAVGRSTVSLMLREVVHAINVALRNEIMWRQGHSATAVATEFEELCGLPGVMGAIDGTHFAISKPSFCPNDYYYFKSGGYSINCQAVVDSSKRFMDLYVGMPGSTNDSRMLRRSTLFYRGQHRNLWDSSLSFHGFSPFLIGDGGYPLLPWLMVPHYPHRQQSILPIAERLFNQRLSRGRSVVENAFGILKLTFRELHGKTDLDVTIVPDVVTCCAILHNVLLNQSHDEVARLLEVIRAQNERAEVVPQPVPADDIGEPVGDNADIEGGVLKRQDLGVFLTLQRAFPIQPTAVTSSLHLHS